MKGRHFPLFSQLHISNSFRSGVKIAASMLAAFICTPCLFLLRFAFLYRFLFQSFLGSHQILFFKYVFFSFCFFHFPIFWDLVFFFFLLPSECLLCMGLLGQVRPVRRKKECQQQNSWEQQPRCAPLYTTQHTCVWVFALRGCLAHIYKLHRDVYNHTLYIVYSVDCTQQLWISTGAALFSYGRFSTLFLRVFFRLSFFFEVFLFSSSLLFQEE